MSQDTAVLPDKASGEFQKLTALINEEIYVRVDAGNVPVTKFKIYDDLIQHYKQLGKLTEANQLMKEHLNDHQDSISSRYMMGIISLMQNKLEDSNHLKTLLEQLKGHGKWSIIEHVADQILLFGEQRMALKYKAEALEKQNKNKELKFVLEKLAKHDRKNPEIAKKYAMSIIDEDKPKAISFLKQAAESFARSKDYQNLEEIWPILISNNFEDLLFFERIERILLANRERTRLVVLLFPLMETYKNLEDYDKTIHFLKKILDNEPLSPKARNELIRAYKSKYAGHSLLDEFLKMSELGNTKKPIKACITNFERNIVFDTNNYVMHRNWGVGKIKSISSESDSIVVDFVGKPDHKLSIQMAITSLKPLKKDHIWVKLYETPNEIHRMFQDDVSNFIAELLTSHDNTMTLNDIKSEIIGRFVKKTEDWTKWWNKAKLALKKDPRIGFNPKKKDEIVFRQKPISLTEELTEKFNAQTDINKKLDIALEALEVYHEAEGAVESFNHFYYEEEEAKDTFRRIIAYIYMEIASGIVEKDDLPRHMSEAEAGRLFSAISKEEAIQFSKQMSNLEVKKVYVNLIRKFHPAWTDIFVGILFEVPVKINKYVFSLLVQDAKFSELNLFLETVMNRMKDFPEIFLWTAKSQLSGLWSYTWMNLNENEMVLRVFRLLKPLSKIEEKGTKLKNMASEILFGNKNEVISKTIHSAGDEFLRRLYALYKEVPFISDSEKEKFLELISHLKPGFEWNQALASEEKEEEEDVLANIPANVVLVTEKGYSKKKEAFDHLVNVEMPENSRDIGEAQEKGDLRENAEYKAAMEKQNQLQTESKKLEHELKIARIIDLNKVQTDKIRVGCKVVLRNLTTSEDLTYSILGPWDADTEKNIISYQSPVGKALLGKKIGQTANVIFEGNATNFEVLSIDPYKES
ncbi:MAG TPA: transcription elongation factor GreA [Leptospiraceae bacterium]|nr:transcription elongation factor GreA [Leptospiraceae bacterium]HNM01365.1 transcription elongation factor GreA [Leptospiraceae bacterium]HNN02518.1 transcription elongation factor GreA [Leptospiraceae bacterium]